MNKKVSNILTRLEEAQNFVEDLESTLIVIQESFENNSDKTYARTIGSIVRLVHQHNIEMEGIVKEGYQVKRESNVERLETITTKVAINK